MQSAIGTSTVSTNRNTHTPGTSIGVASVSVDFAEKSKDPINPCQLKQGGMATALESPNKAHQRPDRQCYSNLRPELRKLIMRGDERNHVPEPDHKNSIIRRYDSQADAERAG